MAEAIAPQLTPSQVIGRIAKFYRVMEEEGLTPEDLQAPIDNRDMRKRLMKIWKQGIPATLLETLKLLETLHIDGATLNAVLEAAGSLNGTQLFWKRLAVAPEELTAVVRQVSSLEIFPLTVDYFPSLFFDRDRTHYIEAELPEFFRPGIGKSEVVATYYHPNRSARWTEIADEIGHRRLPNAWIAEEHFRAFPEECYKHQVVALCWVSGGLSRNYLGFKYWKGKRSVTWAQDLLCEDTRYLVLRPAE